MKIKNLKFKIQNFVQHPLFSGSTLMMGGGMVVNVINYVYHLVMGRILGPVEYGTLASIFSLFYVISIVPLSTSVSIVKFVSSTKTRLEVTTAYRGINRFILYLAFLGGVVIVLLSQPIAEFLNIKNTLNVISVAPIFFFSLMALVNQASSQGLLKFWGFVIPNFISSVGKFLFGVLFVVVGWSSFGAVLGVFWGAFLAYIYSFFYIRRLLIKGSGESFDIKPFLKFSFPALLQALSFTSFFTVDVILVKHFFPGFDAGLYAALSTLGKIIFFAVSPISSVMFPVISGKVAKGEKYMKVFLTSLGLTFLISFGIVFVYTFLPEVAIGVLYGKDYLGAKDLLSWMGLFMAFYAVSYLLTNFFLSIGKTGISYLVLLVAIAQAITIWFFHESLLTVVQISLVLMVFLSLTELTFLLYNSTYAERKY